MPVGARLAALLVALAWGINMLVAKIGTTEIPPLMLTGLRFALVAAVLLPFCRFRRSQLPWLLLLSVTLGTGHFGLLFLGLSMSEVGTGSILVQLGAPISALLGILFLGEALNRARIAGLILSVSGLLILALGPSIPPPFALGLLLASATLWAVSNLIVRIAPVMRPVDINGISSLFCFPQLVLLSLAVEGNPASYASGVSSTGIGAILYMALASSIFAYGIWYHLIQGYSLSSVVPYSLLTPIFAMLFGILLMGDSLSPYKLVGGGVILLGAFILVVFGPPSVSIPED